MAFPGQVARCTSSLLVDAELERVGHSAFQDRPSCSGQLKATPATRLPVSLFVLDRRILGDRRGYATGKASGIVEAIIRSGFPGRTPLGIPLFLIELFCVGI
jgi:hypothetical protein